jgi:hypothetical protein
MTDPTSWAQEEEQDQDRNNRLGMVSHRGKEDHGKKLRKRSCGKTRTDGEAWLSTYLMLKCLRSSSKNTMVFL